MGYTRETKQNKKHSTICIGHHFTQTNTNNVHDFTFYHVNSHQKKKNTKKQKTKSYINKIKNKTTKQKIIKKQKKQIHDNNMMFSIRFTSQYKYHKTIDEKQ